MHSYVTIVGVLIGVMILFFGRKLFWLCVAAVGFAVGVQIAPLLVNEPSSLLALLIALALGVLGALLSVGTFVATVTIIPFMPDGWNAEAGFPAMQGNVAFLMKDVTLLAVSSYAVAFSTRLPTWLRILAALGIPFFAYELVVDVVQRLRHKLRT